MFQLLYSLLTLFKKIITSVKSRFIPSTNNTQINVCIEKEQNTYKYKYCTRVFD